MASNVSINGGNSCTVQSAAGVIAPTNDRKKVIITATGGDGTVKFGTAATAITVKEDTFLDVGAFQGAVTTLTNARAIILS